MDYQKSNQGIYSTETKKTFFKEILHELRKTLRGEAHTMAEIREALASQQRKQLSLIDLLKEHHSYIKESLVVCLDSEAQDQEKQKHLERLLILFSMHAKAEEKTLYRLLADSPNKAVRIEANLGQDEHEVIFNLANELRDMHFHSLWTEDIEAKAMVFAETITHHLKKEEKDIFPLASQHLSEAALKEISSEYLNLCDTDLSMNEIRSKGVYL